MGKTVKKKKVVIMGAGLAGLSCAYELVKQGEKVVVIEKNNWVGGLAHTFEADGFRFDLGPHRWVTKIEEVDDWFKSLMGKKLIRVPRLTRIYFDKKFFYYPMQFKNIFRLGLWTAFRAVGDYFWTRLKTKIKKPKMVSMEDAYVNQFGRTLYEKFFRRYSEKLWGRPCSQLSGDWVVQRSRRMSLLTIIKDVFIRSRGKVVSLADSFLYPRLGIGEATKELKKEVEKRGGKIILGTEVVKVNRQKGKIVSLEIKKKNEPQTIKADEFISSIPLTDLVKIISPAPPKDALQAANKLGYRSLIFVVLLVKGKKFFPDNWIYVHPPEIPYMRFVETDNFSPKMSPQGKTTFVFEIACDEGDKTWRKDKQELIDLVTESFVSEFGVVKKKEIIGGMVARYPKAYPIYSLDYQSPVKKIKKFVYQFPNLQLIGRYGIFRYNNMDHTILTGLYAARNVMGGNFDVESVNIEQEYLEEKKIK